MAGVQLEGAGYASGTKLFLLPRAADGHDKGDEGKRSRRAVGAAIPWPPPGPGARGRVPRASSGPATTRRAFERPLREEAPADRSRPARKENPAALSVGFQRPYRGVGAGVTRTRVRSWTATAPFDCRDGGSRRERWSNRRENIKKTDPAIPIKTSGPKRANRDGR